MNQSVGMAKRTKTEELRKLLGDYVNIQLNDVKMFEKIEELQTLAVSPIIEGYIVDVTDHFIYVGTKLPDSYDTLVDPQTVAFITITEPEPEQEGQLIGFPDPGEVEH